MKGGLFNAASFALVCFGDSESLRMLTAIGSWVRLYYLVSLVSNVKEPAQPNPLTLHKKKGE